MAAVITVASTTLKLIQVAGRSQTIPPHDLISFYARLHTDDSTQLDATVATLSALTVNTGDGVKALQKTKATTAPGPDRHLWQYLGGRVPAAPVQHSSMASSIVLQLWKPSKVTLIPKSGTIKVLNDLRPEALSLLLAFGLWRGPSRTVISPRQQTHRWTHSSLHAAWAERLTMQKHSLLTPYVSIWSPQTLQPDSFSQTSLQHPAATHSD